MVGEARLGSEAVGGLAAEVLCVCRRHRHADPADPFPDAHRRPDYRRRRPLRLSFQAGLTEHGNAMDGFRDAGCGLRGFSMSSDEETAMIRETVAKFVDRELIPL